MHFVNATWCELSVIIIGALSSHCSGTYPMWPQNLDFGIQNRPERTSECPPEHSAGPGAPRDPGKRLGPSGLQWIERGKTGQRYQLDTLRYPSPPRLCPTKYTIIHYYIDYSTLSTMVLLTFPPRRTPRGVGGLTGLRPLPPTPKK